MRMSSQYAKSPLISLLESGRKEIVKKGHIVSGLDDRNLLHLITSGYVKRYMITSEGTHSIQVIYGPGDILPLTPVYQMVFNMNIYRGQETYYYEAIGDAELRSVNQTTLAKAINDNPLIYRDLFYAAGMRLNSYIHRMEDTSMNEIHRRIAHLLLYLGAEFGEATPEGVKILLPLTHQLIGEILDLARETVTRRMAILENSNMIIAGRHIIISDEERLKQESFGM